MNSAEDIIKDKKCEIVSISHDASIIRACQVIVENKIGAIVIRRNDEFVGIYTDRDLMRNIATPGFNPETARVGDHMTTPLPTVSHTAQLHKLEDMFLGLFVRHVLVEKNGEYIGLISIGDILRANLLEKDRQFKEINTLVSWDYYENWKWGRKKKKE